MTDRARLTTADEVRTEVRAWLEENWDPEITVAEWWQRLFESGWAVPHWPEEWYGRGLGGDLAAPVPQEINKIGALGPPAGLGFMLAAPTILAHGSDEQKARLLPPILKGEVAWCQLFSEPGAGSDLASLQCKAVRDGEEWVVTGQKVWTSTAQTADHGMLICRTNPDAPKHKGISYFAMDMDQNGVDIRPLREMTGRALFNEVFLDEARVRQSDLIAGENNGWAVANTTLMNERAGLGGGAAGMRQAMPGQKAGNLDKRVGDLAGKGLGGQVALAGRGYQAMAELAKAEGRTGDPHIRQRLVELYTLNEIGRMSAARARAERKAGVQNAGVFAAPNLAKLLMSRITRLTRDLGLDIEGPKGMLWGKDAPWEGAMQELTTFAPAVSIYGGSDEVQKNIVGERVLGLPKEPGPDKDTPFKDLKVGTQR